jgi:N-acylneuraminate cytidylyltransferase
MTDAMIPLRETGSLYVTRTHIYDNHCNRLGGIVSLFVMDDREGLDIDTEVDLIVASSVLSMPHSDE